jgi:hypothetical protein
MSKLKRYTKKFKLSAGNREQCADWAQSFLYGEISNAKIDQACSLKRCGHSLEATFVLQLFKILSEKDIPRTAYTYKY